MGGEIFFMEQAGAQIILQMSFTSLFQEVHMRSRAIMSLFLFFLLLPQRSFTQQSSHVSGDLKVYYLNVGQADAIFIQCPTGEHSMLIDAADTRYPGSSADFKKELQKLTGGLHKRIDVVVASHNHADHIGNMKWVMENYAVGKFIDDGADPGTALYASLMSVVKKQQKNHTLDYKPLKKADKKFVDFCPADNVEAEVVESKGTYSDCSNQNNCSIVVRLDYSNTSFLFPGDAEEELEKELLDDSETKKELDTDVLKAPHHGSGTSSTLDFMKAVTPRFVVVSSGKKNVGTNVGYKHPQLSSLTNFNSVLPTDKYRKDLIEVYDHDKSKWVKVKAKEGIYFTKVDGDIELVSDGQTILRK